MPASRMASRAMMMVSVVLAFLRVGSRNAITPLLTASTPVMAVQPEEKALSSSHQSGRSHNRGQMRVAG